MDQSQVYTSVHPANSEVTMMKYVLRKRKLVSYDDDTDDLNENPVKKKLSQESANNLANEHEHLPSNINLTMPPNNTRCKSYLKEREYMPPTDKHFIKTKKKSNAINNKLASSANKNFTSAKNYNSQKKNEKVINRMSSVVQSFIHSVNDTDMDIDGISPKFHFDLFSNQAIQDNLSSDSIQISYKYQCFQLNCNDLANNVRSCTDFDSDGEMYSKNYFSCFKQATKHFNNLQPLSSNLKNRAEIELSYDPMLDDLPNYNEFTELELSLLQKVSCGCKPLSWDEYEKMHLIVHKSDTDHLNFLEDADKFGNCTSNPLSSKLDKNSEPKRKFVIKDSKFHFHPNEVNICSVYITDEPRTPTKDNDTSTELDPLHLNFPNIEMVDVNGSVSYKAIEKPYSDNTEDPYSDNTEEVISENIEILPFSTEEMEMLRSRLNSFRLNTSDLETVGEGSDLDEMRSKNEETILQAQTISEAEFSACTDIVEITKDDVNNSTNSILLNPNEDILSNAIYQELVDEGFPFFSQGSEMNTVNHIEPSNISLHKRKSLVLDNDTPLISANIPTEAVPTLSENSLSILHPAESDVQYLIETASSLLNLNETDSCSKEAAGDCEYPPSLQSPVKELSNLQNLTDFESITLDKSVSNHVIGKILSTDEVKLLSDCSVNVASDNTNGKDREMPNLTREIPISEICINSPSMQSPPNISIKESGNPKNPSPVDDSVIDSILTRLLKEPELTSLSSEENLYYLVYDKDDVDST